MDGTWWNLVSHHFYISFEVYICLACLGCSESTQNWSPIHNLVERNVKQRWTDTLHIYELAHVVTSFNKQTCGCQVRTNRTLPTCLEPDQPCCKIGPDGWRLSDKNMISSWDWQCAQDFVPQQSFVQGARVLLCGELAALRVPAANSLRNVPDNLH